ncbi:hypothetical protein AU099_gp51 [Gordonia phage GTE8]|uniref:Uncharacterized protein n=1 Tax=Gordonia phage GTE8 TaxID=1647475 RepID=A0A0K0N650_9CAUD|nr:hypothetical protein AU099_gp51 [Gordonia phage GTE8]AKJ72394.1 hypothetical protein GTE8_51 [Gordonia phage GTE8]
MLAPHLRCTASHVQCSVAHARQVDEYRAERYRQEIERENACSDHPEEIAAYNRTHDMITFKKWLVGSRGQRHLDVA